MYMRIQKIHSGSDPDGDPPKEDWPYASDTGILIYFGANSMSEIYLSVHECARFTNNTREYHEEAMDKVCKYLQGTRMELIISTPTKKLEVNYYIDIDLWIFYGYEDPEYLICAKSSTRNFIIFSECPLL